MNNYDIKLDDFDGPLDLLLSLVQDKKIDILQVNLVELATQYLNIINNLKENDIDIAGDYLVMAATLVQLKAKMILSDPVEKVQVEEDKNLILQRLAEYQEFKKISQALREQEAFRKDIFIKTMSDLDDYIVDKDDTKLDGHSNPLKLIVTLRKMFERVYAQNLRVTKLKTFNLTAKDQEFYIRDLFKNRDEVSFEEVFSVPSLNHFVITLLALLDLSRKQEIVIQQDLQFDKIKLFKGPEYER
ncbi:segregation/condensation protein A [Mycoplasmopsis pullorum]|uniref:segregation/condensation protein A n=1 Tax=Mycoplasmopsis pullorum TaxID=48003 RepID=UPI00111A5E00|nr:segregation/condensation protein A [Mycoplasmopsis pullorum]TNK83340.1 segregation/condensation protein A [Mycoplasmopsis pullorum]TNK92360.1 segregation/condensation protein A [Mycoplasmopsis pullorum]